MNKTTKEQMPEITPVTDLTKYLKQMQKGERCRVPASVCRESLVRARASYLRTKGYLFGVSVDSLSGDTYVTCVTSPALCGVLK